jgi:hypothetical protein
MWCTVGAVVLPEALRTLALAAASRDRGRSSPRDAEALPKDVEDTEPLLRVRQVSLCVVSPHSLASSLSPLSTLRYITNCSHDAPMCAYDDPTIMISIIMISYHHITYSLRHWLWQCCALGRGRKADYLTPQPYCY